MNRLKLALTTGFFLVAVSSMAFAASPYKCKVEIRYGAHRSELQQEGGSIQSALIAGMRTGCRLACQNVDASSDGDARLSCVDACLREAIFNVAYCIDHHTQNTFILPAEAIEQARHEIASDAVRRRSDTRKPDLYNIQGDAKGNKLLLTRWYGAYIHPKKRETDRKDRTDRASKLMEIKPPQRSLVVTPSKQSPLLKLR